MFRYSTVIRELALNLSRVIFTLKHSVKLRRYLLCGCVAACHGMACVLYAVQNAQHVYFNVNFNVFFKLIKVHLYSATLLERGGSLN